MCYTFNTRDNTSCKTKPSKILKLFIVFSVSHLYFLWYYIMCVHVVYLNPHKVLMIFLNPNECELWTITCDMACTGTYGTPVFLLDAIFGCQKFWVFDLSNAWSFPLLYTSVQGETKSRPPPKRWSTIFWALRWGANLRPNTDGTRGGGGERRSTFGGLTAPRNVNPLTPSLLYVQDSDVILAPTTISNVYWDVLYVVTGMENSGCVCCVCISSYLFILILRVSSLDLARHLALYSFQRCGNAMAKSSTVKSVSMGYHASLILESWSDGASVCCQMFVQVFVFLPVSYCLHFIYEWGFIYLAACTCVFFCASAYVWNVDRVCLRLLFLLYRANVCLEKSML